MKAERAARRLHEASQGVLVVVQALGAAGGRSRLESAMARRSEAFECFREVASEPLGAAVQHTLAEVQALDERISQLLSARMEAVEEELEQVRSGRSLVRRVQVRHTTPPARFVSRRV